MLIAVNVSDRKGAGMEIEKLWRRKFYVEGLMPCCGEKKKYKEILDDRVRKVIACAWCGEQWIICEEAETIKEMYLGKEEENEEMLP